MANCGASSGDAATAAQILHGVDIKDDGGRAHRTFDGVGHRIDIGPTRGCRRTIEDSKTQGHGNRARINDPDGHRAFLRRDQGRLMGCRHTPRQCRNHDPGGTLVDGELNGLAKPLRARP